MATPLLITPDGKTIELSPKAYRQIQEILHNTKSDQTALSRVGAAQATYGKYAGEPSLIQALLKARKTENAREETKFRRRNV